MRRPVQTPDADTHDTASCALPGCPLTVKLRGRALAFDWSRGCTLASSTCSDTTELHGPLQRLLDSRCASTKVSAQRSSILVTHWLIRYGWVGWIDPQQAIVKHPRVHMNVQMRHLLICRLANGVPQA